MHTIVVKQLPKEFEDKSGWGGTIPAEPNLRLANLRTFIKVDDKLMMPHGAWRKFKGKLEHPDKNLKIVVKEFKQLDDKTYRVVADVDATVSCSSNGSNGRRAVAHRRRGGGRRQPHRGDRLRRRRVAQFQEVPAGA